MTLTDVGCPDRTRGGSVTRIGSAGGETQALTLTWHHVRAGDGPGTTTRKEH